MYVNVVSLIEMKYVGCQDGYDKKGKEEWFTVWWRKSAICA